MGLNAIDKFGAVVAAADAKVKNGADALATKQAGISNLAALVNALQVLKSTFPPDATASTPLLNSGHQSYPAVDTTALNSAITNAQNLLTLVNSEQLYIPSVITVSGTTTLSTISQMLDDANTAYNSASTISVSDAAQQKADSEQLQTVVGLQSNLYAKYFATMHTFTSNMV